jgi:ribonuclease III
LIQRIQYTFRNQSLLAEALQHSSFVNEVRDQNLRDNERLEFLGDAVLNLVIGHLLMEHFPDLTEGDLSKKRALLVNEASLATVARTINLGSYLRLGKGEEHSNGRNKDSLLANALEAVFAAIYIDGGFDSIFSVIRHHFFEALKELHTSTTDQDHKGRLQELAQLKNKDTPTYKIVKETGPDHAKTFCVELEIFDIKTDGQGRNKKMAEQNAAKKALKLLEES